MEGRKVIKFGNSSYVVTLPFEWVRKHNIDKNSVVNLNERGENILLSIPKEKESLCAQIALENKTLKQVNRELISYYLKNYNFITIKGRDIIEQLEAIKTMKEKLSSIEIIEIGKDSIVLKDLTSVKDLDVHRLIYEIVEMLKLVFDELLKSSGDSNRHFFISTLDSNINKLSFLGYKAINYNLGYFSAPDEVKDCIHYWRIIASLEQIGDILKRKARYLKDKTGNEEFIHIKETMLRIKEYFTFITSMIENEGNLDNNLSLYYDKKQSLLREFEELRSLMQGDLTLYLVITQLFKDVLGEIDKVVLSVIDLKNK